MNTKGGVSAILFVFFFIGVSGFVLWILEPTIEQTRLDGIAQLPSDSIVGRIILYALKPIIWGMYLFLSAVLLVSSMATAGGVD